jgi:hypothetical protein
VVWPAVLPSSDLYNSNAEGPGNVFGKTTDSRPIHLRAINGNLVTPQEPNSRRDLPSILDQCYFFNVSSVQYTS